MAINPNHRWKVLAVGVAANVSFSSVVGGLPAAAVYMRDTYHLDTAQLGVVLGVLGLGIAVSEIPWGLLTDRWGDRRILLTGLFSSAMALIGLALLSALVPTALVVAMGLFAVGLLGSSVNGASGRAIMVWFSERERGFAMSIRQTAVPGGYALGAIVLPWLAHAYGFVQVFAVAATGCVLAGLFAWAWLLESGLAAFPMTSGPDPSPLRDPGVWRMVLAISLLCVPQFTILTYAAVFFHDVGPVDIAVVSAVLAIIQVGAIIGRIWSGRWTDRHRNRLSYLTMCAWLSALSFLTLGLTVSAINASGLNTSAYAMALIILVMVAAGICVSVWHGVAYTELASLAGASRAGTALAMGNTAVFVALFLTPVTVSVLLSQTSWCGVWLAAASCALATVPMFSRAERLQPRQSTPVSGAVED